MRLNRFSGRLAAMMMTGVMTASMLGMTAFAEENTTDPTGDAKPVCATSILTKEIEKEENVYAPETRFSFTIQGVGEQTGVTDENGTTLISPDGGLVFSKTGNTRAEIVSSPQASDIGMTTVTAGTLQLEVKADAFTTPGVYRYKITETNGNYEGIAYDTAERYVDVFIYKDADPEILFVNEEGTAKADGIVTNEYGLGDTPDTDLYDLILTKHVTGNQSVAGKKFTFTITIDGAEGERYLVKYGTGSSQTTKMIISDDTEGVTVELSDGESAVIYGLSKTDAYTITEDSYEREGYKTYMAHADGTGTLLESAYTENNRRDTATGSYADAEEGALENKAVHVYNDKTVTTPTGIALSAAPYVLMVAMAGAFAALFLRKKRNEF